LQRATEAAARRDVPKAAPSPAHAGAPKRKFWQRWLVDPIVRQLTQGVTPGKIALSLAVGSALALFPILGTTTALCFLAGILLSLNQPIIQGVNALCTFIYFPLIVVFVRFGDRLTGAPPSSLNIPAMISLFSHHPGQFFREFGVTGLHAMLGWIVVAPFWIALIYFLSLPGLRVAARRIGRP
jgi:uncharacterized protein (DUF2062 family)